MPLRTLVSEPELRLLEAALRWLEQASLKAFARLFESLDVAPKLPDAVAAPLLAFDLVEREGDGVRGLLRVRRHNGRFYVMELGLGSDIEYQQDVWPETDALLDALATFPPCRLLDLGTGCGIVAVEAAARGHQVVATDLYQPTLVLARFNARLNRLAEGIEWRQGHLWEPVAGERFDRVLTNPHYGRSDDQLRLELLRGVPEHLRPGGRLVLATALEWDDEARPRRLGVECVLRPLAAAGLDVVVRPLHSDYKRNWFSVARGQPGLSSRQRFTIEVTANANANANAKLEVIWPDEPDAPVRHFVALSRLTRGGQHATAAGAADAARLADWAARLAAPDVTFFEPLPAGLLDSCRWGARVCVGPRGAAGAIVDPDGAVRPCAHGPTVAHAGETLATLTGRYEQLAEEARARRGCATCPAEASCSRCLFPVALDDQHYCAMVRQNAAGLTTLIRLLKEVACLDEEGVAPGPLRLRRWPRPLSPDSRPLPPASIEWSRLQAWIVERAGRAFVCFPQRFHELTPAAAELCAAFADGAEVSRQASALFARLLAGE